MITLVRGNALHIPLPDKSVQCVVTSPPYWGLRDYGTNEQLGLEKTPEEYVANMVAVFREVWRVLRDDGTLWLNLGDSYAGSWGNYSPNTATPSEGWSGKRLDRPAYEDHTWRPPNSVKQNGLKTKDMVGIPWRVAFALQVDGWYLRSDIIWAKPNPMPESVRDRPTKSHEYLFLLSKQERYFYDAEAVKEPGSMASLERISQPNFDNQTGGEKDYGNGTNKNRSMRKTLENFADKQRGHSRRHAGFNDRWDAMSKEEQCAVMRNKRDVWTIATSPYAGAHFATFPPALVEPCILAGTSAMGECSNCGAPWTRIVEREFVPQPDVSLEKGIKGGNGQKPSYEGNSWDGTPRGTTAVTTMGWVPSCCCNAGEPVPQLVMDPFSGSGTVGQVCLEHGRRYVGVELKAEYIELARERLYNRQIGFGI